MFILLFQKQSVILTITRLISPSDIDISINGINVLSYQVLFLELSLISFHPPFSQVLSIILHILPLHYFCIIYIFSLTI